ncbi:MAG: hypothetical protein JSR37_06205 [Verrucomicrobia bacterium]|nr:hypothetical protein [Verrucomicrobiota bacterium]MBS0637572.1 hypothetical protein [Verrucomicrobiota bacterium]
MATPDSGNVANTQDDPNADFWVNMDYVLQQKQLDAIEDEKAEQQIDAQEEERFNKILQSLNPNNDGGGILNVLQDNTPPSPINLAGGASAPPTTNSSNKMNNNINGV